MNRLIAVVALALPLLASTPSAHAGSTFCTDNNPPGEFALPIVDAAGVYVAGLVHPFAAQPLVGICYRLPDTAGGQFVGGIVYVSVPNTATAGTGGVSGTAIANLDCRSDATSTTVNCSEMLGGVGIVVGNPVMTGVGGSTPPCIVFGICIGGPTGVAGGTSSVTVYLPLGGTVFVPVTVPTQCVVNPSGPC